MDINKEDYIEIINDLMKRCDELSLLDLILQLLLKSK